MQMKTARMSAPDWTTTTTTTTKTTTTTSRTRSNSVTESSTPSQEAIDAYAQQVLERHATEDCEPDESLGSYITSLLRLSMNEDVTQIPDYEGLLELLQEHCGLDTEEKAKQTLQEICTTVVENRLPITAVMESSKNGYYPAVMPASSPPLRPAQPPPIQVDDEEEFPSLSEATATVQITPQRADSLIPLHLLDEDEAAGAEDSLDTNAAAEESKVEEETKREALPPLGKRTKPPPKKALSSSSSTSSASSHHNNRPQSASAPDLAAALFHPARSRQSSIDESASSNSPHLMAAPVANSHVTTTTSFHLAAAAADPYQYEEVQNMLLAMTDGLCPQAAYAAAVLAQGDVSVAHYVVQAAMTAPPICRHLLQSGCYRSDCTFSHNVGQHTCLFWLRGRCGKGEACRFLHGFSEKLLPYYNNISGEYSQQGEGYYAYGGYNVASSSSLQPTTVAAAPLQTPQPGSFANIASKGYSVRSSFAGGQGTTTTTPAPRSNTTMTTTAASISNLPTVKIPGDLWNPHENRDAAAFYISDPVERYHAVMATHPPPRDDTAIMDLHFQSTKTFAVVLQTVLPDVLRHHGSVWIVTGTGHHVGSKTHQKGGGALETAVLQWLVDQQDYRVFRGKDRNGQGGAILVKR